MTHGDRYDAHDDLGGRIPESMEIGSKVAIVQMGLGSKAMRLEVARYLQDQEDARQHAINTDGAALVREAGIAADAAAGVDTDSVEYRVKQRLAEERRTRRI